MRIGVVLALVLALAAACGGDGEPDDAQRSEAAAYAAVVRWFADEEPPMETDDLRDAFLDGLDDGAVPIDVQVAVVNALEDEVKVRFIDAPEEAIDTDIDGAPVRNRGLLLHLGALVARDGEVEVDVGHYVGAGEITRYRVVLVQRGDEWRLAGDPVPLSASA